MEFTLKQFIAALKCNYLPVYIYGDAGHGHTGKYFHIGPNEEGMDSVPEKLLEMLVCDVRIFDNQVALYVYEPEEPGTDPYTKEYLEYLVRGVVNYEAEEPDDLGRMNLEAMGFSEEDMLYFGYPERIDEEE